MSFTSNSTSMKTVIKSTIKLVVKSINSLITLCESFLLFDKYKDELLTQMAIFLNKKECDD